MPDREHVGAPSDRHEGKDEPLHARQLHRPVESDREDGEQIRNDSHDGGRQPEESLKDARGRSLQPLRELLEGR